MFADNAGADILLGMLPLARSAAELCMLLYPLIEASLRLAAVLVELAHIFSLALPDFRLHIQQELHACLNCIA